MSMFLLQGIWLKIDNIASNVKKDALEKLLAEHGKVKKVYEFGDRHLLSSALVDVETKKDQAHIVKTLNKTEISGQLRVENQLYQHSG